MPGTRVYFTSEVQDGRVSISFKNISQTIPSISRQTS